MTRALPKVCRRAATGSVDLANSNGRIVRYLFSDPSVARDNHTIRAWKLDNFAKNAVALWCHDASSPPIGRVIEIEDQKGYLRGSIEYAERDVYPFADTVYQLVRGGYVNAVSVSWDPIEWSFTTDRSRPGGIDFNLAELLEISNVPVPALPTALATARANGIDTGPLYDWAEKVLDTRARLLVPRKTLEQIRIEAKMPARGGPGSGPRPGGGNKNKEASEGLSTGAKAMAIMEGFSSAYATAFAAGTLGGLVATGSLATALNVGMNLGAASMALGGIALAGMAAVKLGAAGVSAVKSALTSAKSKRSRAIGSRADDNIDDLATEIAALSDAEVKAFVEALLDGLSEEDGAEILDALKKEQDEMEKKAEEKRAASVAKFRRGLYDVAQLAYQLNELGYLQWNVAWEAEAEGDNSTVPAQIADAIKALGAALVAMTAEEVAEFTALMGERSVEVPADSGVRYVAHLDRALPREAVERLAATLTKWATQPDSVLVLDPDPGIKLLRIAGETMTEIAALPVVSAQATEGAHTRAGRVLSSANAQRLRAHCDDIERGHKGLREFLDENGDECDPEDGDPDCQDERARAAGEAVAAAVIAAAADEAAKATRARKAKALKRKLALVPAEITPAT